MYEQLPQESSYELHADDVEELAEQHLLEIAQSQHQLWDVKGLATFVGNESPEQTMRRITKLPTFYDEGAVRVTPCKVLATRSDGHEAFTKDERHQSIKAFKIRGATWASAQALRQNPRLQGTVQASAGNAGQGGADFAEYHNQNGVSSIEAHVFMAKSASSVKKRGLRMRNAIVHDVDPESGEPYADLREAQAGARRYVEASTVNGEPTLALLEPYSHPDTIAGQGTITAETYVQLRAQGVDVRAKPVRFRVGGGGWGLGLGMAVGLQTLIQHQLVHPGSYIEVTQEEQTDAYIRAFEALDATDHVDLEALFDDDEFSILNDGTAVQVPDVKNLAAAYHLYRTGLLQPRRTTRAHVGAAMATRPGDADLEPAGALGLASLLEDTSSVSAYLGEEQSPYVDVVVLSGGNVSEETKDYYTNIAEQPRNMCRAGAAFVTRHYVPRPEQRQPGPSRAMRLEFLSQLEALGISLVN